MIIETRAYAIAEQDSQTTIMKSGLKNLFIVIHEDAYGGLDINYRSLKQLSEQYPQHNFDALK